MKKKNKNKNKIHTRMASFFWFPDAHAVQYICKFVVLVPDYLEKQIENSQIKHQVMI